jgi:hypothetical protein
MIADYLDRNEVGGYVAAMKQQLKAGALDDKAPAAAAGIGRGSPDQDPAAAVQAVLDALPDDNTGAASSGGEDVNSPFFSRAPMVSLLQTSLEDEARKSGIVHERKPGGPFSHVAGVVETIEHKIDSILHPQKFSTDDPDWVTKTRSTPPRPSSRSPTPRCASSSSATGGRACRAPARSPSS